MVELTNLILAFATLLGAIGALVIGLINSQKLNNVHLDINSRMTELLRVTGAEQRAAGMAEERDKTQP